MVDFSEERLEVKWGVGANGGPGFSTNIVVSSSGYDYTNINWDEARYRYDIGNRNIKKAEKDYLIAFFHNRRGRGQGFRFKDWTDYQGAQQLIGTGNGSSRLFQVYKNYTQLSSVTSRKITKLVAGSLIVTVNAVPTTAFVVDNNTGIINFDVAPTTGHEIRVTYAFDVPVRFDVDQFDVSVIQDTGADGIYSLGSLPVVELKL